MPDSKSGFLLLDKPAGLSSFQALRPVKKLYRGAKVGHAGTLDPAASGLLLVGVGPATRLLEYMEALPKTYAFTARLGVATDTYDMEGKVLETRDAGEVTEGKLEAALARFRGSVEQTPPAYSALKVQGERAYDLARAGKTVSLPSRTVFIHSLELKNFAQGEAVLEMTCSKGTYVRSLVQDLGRDLGCGAAADNIRRTAIGSFRVEDAVAPENLIDDGNLLPLSAAVGHLPGAALATKNIPAFLNGMPLPKEAYAGMGSQGEREDDGLRRVLDGEGRLLGIAAVDSLGRLIPKKILVGNP